MEGNASQGGMISGVPPFVDLQGSTRVRHEGFALTMGTMYSSDHNLPMADHKKVDRGENSGSDDDNNDDDGLNRGKKGSSSSSHWQRVKWTEKMIKLLITAVSYAGEDGPSSDCCGGSGRKRKSTVVLQKKGKWKSVSKAMDERGFVVSPQQCEDKFNDLNKRYKKLNDIIGRGTSCQVVENPALLDVIDYLSEKEKSDVRKILSSKHLFYEEMCSYHNGNRLHLPHDPALQRSLQLALRSNRDDDDHGNDDFDDDDEDHDDDDDDDHHGDGKSLIRQAEGRKDVCQVDMNRTTNETEPQGGLAQKQWIESRTLQLEEERLQIEVERLELERQRFKWQRFSRKRDQELEMSRMENERMKLENERMSLELKRKIMN
ncbi:hypothetical protein LINPERHAP2_LOCUS32171 [Linum perenne]